MVTLIVTGISFDYKKDSDPPNLRCRIITVSIGAIQINFSYDSEGKLASISFGTLTTSLTYNGNTVITNTKKGQADN